MALAITHTSLDCLRPYSQHSPKDVGLQCVAQQAQQCGGSGSAAEPLDVVLNTAPTVQRWQHPHL